MTRFLRPQSIPPLPQGDFSFLPQVRVFATVIDPADLQTEINAWLVAWVANPDFTIDVINVEYQTTNLGANTMHSALLHYTLITLE